MKNYKFELSLAAFFLAILVAALAFWGDWAGGKMTREDVDQYLIQIDKNLEWPEPMKSYMMQSLREWGYADDGKELMMLNMMRYHDEPLDFPGSIKDFKGTPKEANYKYELGTKDILLPQGGYPVAWGEVTSSRNVARADGGAANTHWNRVGFARYPNRRGFFRLMADPQYGKQSAYKLMGAHTNLIPMTPQWVVPDLRLITGLVLLILFFTIGWIRAELRNRH
ncbi:MAG: hypothetical protein V7700_16730 [Halioglobus sp.]